MIRKLILLTAAALGFGLFGSGIYVIGTGTAYQTCYTSSTGTGGVLGAIVGLIILVAVAFVAWDEYQ